MACLGSTDLIYSLILKKINCIQLYLNGVQVPIETRSCLTKVKVTLTLEIDKKMAIFGYLVLEQNQKYSLTLLKVMLQACATLLNDIDIADIGCLN